MSDVEADVPEVADVPDVDDTPETEVSDDVEQDDPPTDVDEATVDLTDDDLGGGDLFDSVDDVEDDDQDGASDSSSSSGGDGDGDGDSDDAIGGLADLEGASAEMEEAINEGMARLGVIGLTEEDFDESNLSREDLQEEFEQTFSAFRLGHFGAQAVEEYILQPADGEVSPIWGFLGAAMMAGAMMVWMRPDGDEKVEAGREAISKIAGGVA